MILLDTLIVLDISYQFGGVSDAIHPVLLVDDKSMVLVDCGFSGFLPAVEQAALGHGLDLQNLTHVIITHHDHDHMGALHALKSKYPKVRVLSSREEEPYICGREKSLRLAQAEKRQAELPDDHKAFGEAFIKLLRGVQPQAVDDTVQDGDVLPFCGGVHVIATPGHTPGHISLYLPIQKVLIAGDAAVLENERAAIANPAFTLDMEAAQRSLEKLLESDAETIVFYHGGSIAPSKLLYNNTKE